MTEIIRVVWCRVTAVIVVVCMLVSACTAVPYADDPNLSPAENQLRQANQRFTQTVGEAAAIGVLAGSIAGLALGGKQGAALGAAAGGLVGVGAGYLVARNNLSRSSTEAQFNDAIQQASADADAYRSSATASRAIADQANAEATRLRSQVRARRISLDDYRANVAKYKADNDIIAQQINSAQKAVEVMRQDSGVASGANSTKLSATAADVEASRRLLVQSQARLSRIIDGAA